MENFEKNESIDEQLKKYRRKQRELSRALDDDEDDYLNMRKEGRRFRAFKDDRDFEIGPEDYIFDKG